jgi:transcriptional regulator with XRE-family HTH domain
LAAIREDRGLTRAEFAAAIGESEGTIRAWENEICHHVPMRDMKKWARVLRCSVRDLLGLIYDPIPMAPRSKRRK